VKVISSPARNISYHMKHLDSEVMNQGDETISIAIHNGSMVGDHPNSFKTYEPGQDNLKKRPCNL
jgi:hypothetical protein